MTDGVFNAWATAKWNVLGEDEASTLQLSWVLNQDPEFEAMEKGEQNDPPQLVGI